jgi:FkbM family methyltransferase
VEADPFLAPLLHATTRLNRNRGRTIRVLCSAVSDRQSFDRFVVAQRGRSSNALEETNGRSQTRGMRYVLDVPTTTLDLLLDDFPPPHVVKIDVQGVSLAFWQAKKTARVDPHTALDRGW